LTTIERATAPLQADERTTLEGWLDLAVDRVEAERVLGVEQPGGDLWVRRTVSQLLTSACAADGDIGDPQPRQH